MGQGGNRPSDWIARPIDENATISDLTG
jgi:hypothetical protein